MKAEFILAQTSFFRGLKEDSRRALAEIAVLRTLRRREVLFREGEEGHAVFLLNRGRVQLQKQGADGTPVIIKTVQPGETFAEVILFEQPRYPVTAIAVSDCSLFLFPKREFRALLRREDFRDDFIAMLMRRQRYLAEQIATRATADAEIRLWRFLREQYGDAPRVETELTKKAVADAIGVTPETLSRLLKKLARRRQLIWRGKVLLRPSAGRSDQSA